MMHLDPFMIATFALVHGKFSMDNYASTNVLLGTAQGHMSLERLDSNGLPVGALDSSVHRSPSFAHQHISATNSLPTIFEEDGYEQEMPDSPPGGYSPPVPASPVFSSTEEHWNLQQQEHQQQLKYWQMYAASEQDPGLQQMVQEQWQEEETEDELLLSAAELQLRHLMYVPVQFQAAAPRAVAGNPAALTAPYAAGHKAHFQTRCQLAFTAAQLASLAAVGKTSHKAAAHVPSFEPTMYRSSITPLQPVPRAYHAQEAFASGADSMCHAAVCQGGQQHQYQPEAAGYQHLQQLVPPPKQQPMQHQRQLERQIALLSTEQQAAAMVKLQQLRAVQRLHLELQRQLLELLRLGC